MTFKGAILIIVNFYNFEVMGKNSFVFTDEAETLRYVRQCIKKR
jgi:hypothetical protein